MAKTATVKASIEPQKKERVSRILKRLGLNHSEAINIFYSLIEEHQGLPFDIRLAGNDSDEIETKRNLRPKVMEHLKDSIQKNRKLGELLAQ